MRPLLVAVAVAAGVVTGCAPAGPGPVLDTLSGRVVGLDDEPVAGAEVRAGAARTTTDAAGGFTLPVDVEGAWVSVRHAGYLGRTRAGMPGDPLLLRLTPDDGETVALQFGGDVMTGRRFFDRDEDGRRGDALIDDPADVEAHRRLLEPIAPLLADADVSEVNVESPVVEDPYLDPGAPRREGVHPTKDYVFASGPALPEALAASGVDVVGLANNHQYDLLEPGVRATVDAFDAAGFARGSGQFGLGPDPDAASAPAVVEVRGVRVAFLGCTSVTGEDNRIAYVAGPAQGGAAPCAEDRVRATVAAAAGAADLVVFSVHGGYEYDRRPSTGVQRISAVAREAGAALVVNHHPHVVGGLDWDGRGLAAWSLGNLVFDQTVWPTFQSYVLAVHVRRGQIVRAYLEPVMVNEYVAHGVGTALADRVARTAAGLSRGPFVLEDGAVELDLGRPADRATVTADVGGGPEGQVGEVGPGWSIEDADPRSAQFGTDLLWTGDFEDDVVGDESGLLWASGDGRGIRCDGRAATGRCWYEVRRDGTDADPVVGTTLHRVLLEDPRSVANRRAGSDGPGGALPPPQLTLLARVRADPGARAEVRVAWFTDTSGPSSDQVVRTVDPGPGEWQPLRLDLDVPADAVAAAVQVRLAPGDGAAALAPAVTAGLDRVRLVAWDPRGTPAGPGATHVRTYAPGQVTVARVGPDDGAPPLTAAP